MNQKLRRGPAITAAIMFIILLLLNLFAMISPYFTVDADSRPFLVNQLPAQIMYCFYFVLLCVAMFSGKANMLSGVCLALVTVLTVVRYRSNINFYSVVQIVFYAVLSITCFINKTVNTKKFSWVYTVLGIVVGAAFAYNTYSSTRMMLGLASGYYLSSNQAMLVVTTLLPVLLMNIPQIVAHICMGVAFTGAKEPDPAQETGYAANAAGGTAAPVYVPHVREYAYMNLGLHILLLLVTGGIWALIWVYRTTEYLNNTPGTTRQSAIGQLLLYMFVPFYAIYWFYAQGKRIDQMSQSRNLPSNQATMCLLLGIFFPLLAAIIMQSAINRICDTAPAQRYA